jgi:hypothetical protein
MNRAVRQAKGAYIKMMDDDNIAEPHEISTFMRVAQKTGADVVTCIVPSFAGDEPPPPKDDPTAQLLLLVGPSLSVGAFQCGFGDNNCLVKRSVYLDIGGLSEARDLGNIDWEFLSRAALKGCHMEVVPEILYRYRRSYSSMSRTTPYYANSMLNLQAYLDHLSPAFRPAMRLAFGLTVPPTFHPPEAIDWRRPRAAWRMLKLRAHRAMLALRGYYA